MAPNKKDNRKELPLGARQKQYALSVILRRKEAFSSIKGQLGASAFDTAGDRGYGIVWAVLNDFYKKHDEPPNEEVFLAEVEARLQIADDIDDESRENLQEFIDGAYGLPDDQINIRMAMRYLSRMISEQTQYSLLQDIQSGVCTDLAGVLQHHINVATLAGGLEAGAAPLPFPTSPEEMKSLVLEKTGIRFLDGYMNGGMARKEVNGFCGPYGSCKTTLGVMLAVERARHMIDQWRANGEKGLPQRVYYFSWEEGMDLLRPRFLSYAAGIHRASLEGDNFQASLSRSNIGSLKPYEKQLYKDKIAAGIIEGEYDRMQAAMTELNLNLRIMDFVDDPKYSAMAGQLVPGIVTAIDLDQRMANPPNPGVALVVVDYAGAVADRAIQAGTLKQENLRHAIGKMPMALKSLVASPFDCQVWALHQLGTEANSRAAGVAPKSTDTSEARNFFENVNFGFMVGKPDRNNLTVLTNGKQRRARRQDDIVIHIDGAMSRVEDASHTHLVMNEKIEARAEIGRIVHAPERSDSRDSLFDGAQARRRNDDGIGVG